MENRVGVWHLQENQNQSRCAPAQALGVSPGVLHGARAQNCAKDIREKLNDFGAGGSVSRSAPVPHLGGPSERLLSVREVAVRLGVSRATVYGLATRGDLRNTRVSNAMQFSQADVAAFERAHTA